MRFFRRKRKVTFNQPESTEPPEISAVNDAQPADGGMNDAPYSADNQHEHHNEGDSDHNEAKHDVEDHMMEHEAMPEEDSDTEPLEGDAELMAALAELGT